MTTAKPVPALDTAYDDLNRHLRIAAHIGGAHCWRYDIPSMKLIWSENAGAEIGEIAVSKRDTDISSALWNTLHPDDAERVRDTLMDPPAECGEFDFRRIAADGTDRHMRTSYQCFQNEVNARSHIIGTTRDITGEIGVQQQLSQQAEEMKALHERLERAATSSQEGHWEADFATGKHWCSDVYRELLGYGPDHDFTTMETYQAICHPDELEGQYHMVMALKDGEAYERTIRLKHADGTWRWMQVRGTLERDSHGQPVRLTGNIRSVHEQTLMQNQLNEYQARFSRAINGTQDGLWELNLNTHELWMSPRCAEILGYMSRDVVQWNENNIAAITHAEDLERVRKALHDARRFGKPYDLEYRMQLKSGLWIWVNVRGKVTTDEAGNAISISGSLQDVTEAHHARVALEKATEQARAANHAKSAFLANMSHELRTPMNGIIGMAQLLAATPLNETQREFSEIISTSAQSLLAIINDVLDLSKIEASKLTIEFIDFELRDSIEDVMAMMTTQIATKNLELIVDVQPDLPSMIKGDPHRIRQCLLNLMSNAFKFTQQGEILIKVESKQNGIATMLEFSVTDTGIGISPQAAERLFQPFEQADSSTTRRFGGTGLGLSIIKRLVELMGGQIGVDSAEGQGSRFWFTIPLVESTMTAPIMKPQADHQRILVLAGNEHQRAALSRQLHALGYKVDQCNELQPALSLLKSAHSFQQTYSAMFLDVDIAGLRDTLLNHKAFNELQLHNTRCVLLCPVNRRQESQRIASSINARILCKPLRHRELIRHLIESPAQVNSAENENSIVPASTSATPTSKAEQLISRLPGHVLLVEDNVVNQKVAVRFLQRLGAKVTVASDGAEGVAILKRGNFALVLMDIQMPVMDGYEATRNIRELKSEKRSVPIVALTANAMPEDREKCLAAGMNDFLTKPVQIDKLTPIVNQYCKKQSYFDTTLSDNEVQAILSSRAANSPIAAASQVDFEKLLGVVGDDRDFLAELVSAYSQTAHEASAELHAAQQIDDREAIARIAHKLKGASSNMYINPVSELASTLEKKASAITGHEVNVMISTLEQCIQSALSELIQSAAAQKPAA